MRDLTDEAVESDKSGKDAKAIRQRFKKLHELSPHGFRRKDGGIERAYTMNPDRRAMALSPPENIDKE